ncbi:hypothetical protein ACTMTJ_20610 [Phytohabitans sp. LJ34]|uniref:hypothetical protein n=1 Tax=Phytohabitans sp. LJ34 TaxID=3452217 RepID=UPI003F8CCE27
MRTRLSRVLLAATAAAAITAAGVAVATPASAAADAAAPAAATAEAAQSWIFWARYYDMDQCVDVGDQGLRLGLWSMASCQVNDVFDSVDLWVLV